MVEEGAEDAWLRTQGAMEAHTADALFDSAIDRLRSLRVELPAEGELQRLVNSALNSFFQDIQCRICDALAVKVRTRIDALLTVPESAAVSVFEELGPYRSFPCVAPDWTDELGATGRPMKLGVGHYRNRKRTYARCRT